MATLNRTIQQIKFKQGLFTDINTTATKNVALIGEPHYATDVGQLFIFDGSENKRIPTVTASGIYFGSSTNNVAIDLDGNLRLNGTATVFDDLIGDISRLRVVGVGIAYNDTENAINFQSTANLSDYCLINFQIPHKWKAGSTVFPHIHYEQTGSSTPNFMFEYRWQKNGGTKTTSWTRLICKTSAFSYTSGDLNQIAVTASGITPANYNISDVLELRIYRDNANNSSLFSGADTAGSNVYVTSVDTHIEVDSLGSNTEFVK